MEFEEQHVIILTGRLWYSHWVHECKALCSAEPSFVQVYSRPFIKKKTFTSQSNIHYLYAGKQSGYLYQLRAAILWCLSFASLIPPFAAPQQTTQWIVCPHVRSVQAQKHQDENIQTQTQEVLMMHDTFISYHMTSQNIHLILFLQFESE